MTFPGEEEIASLPSRFFFDIARLFVLVASCAWFPVKWCLDFIWDWMIQGYVSGRPEIYGYSATPPTFHYAWYDVITYLVIVFFFAWAAVNVIPNKVILKLKYSSSSLDKEDYSVFRGCIILWCCYIFANPICYIPCLIAFSIVSVDDRNALYNRLTAAFASVTFVPACLLSLATMSRLIELVKSFIFQRIAVTMLCIPTLFFIGFAKMTFLFGWAGFPRYLMWLIFQK